MEKIAAILVAAHLVGDFLLQPDGLVRRKTRFRYLLLHSAIHAALVYGALQAWKCWQAPFLVLAIHTAIDRIKQGRKDTVIAFVVDQATHVVSLLALAWWMVHYAVLPGYTGIGYKPLVALGGLVATVQGSGFLVGKFARRLIEENQLKLDGLLNGGRLIGQLERALIFLFIFTGQAAGIGFLVAAKSILRFEEAKKQQLAEYVLIGTLLSFSLAIALTTATRWAMEL